MTCLNQVLGYIDKNIPCPQPEGLIWQYEEEDLIWGLKMIITLMQQFRKESTKKELVECLILLTNIFFPKTFYPKDEEHKDDKIKKTLRKELEVF
jgi:hypothetical protein